MKKKSKIIAFGMIIAFFVGILTPVSATTWEPYVNVTNDTQSQYHVSLFVDSNGYAHIAWSNTTTYIGIPGINGYIFYSNNTGGSFSTPILIPAPVNGSWSPSLAVDAFGYAHITFFGGNVTASGGDGTQTQFTDVFYSTNKGSVDSSFQTIKLTDYSPSGSTDLWPDLALDSSGYAHIAWRDNVGDIRYGNNTSGDFGDEKVTNQNGAPIFRRPSIALDDSDGVHIAFYGWDGNDQELYYTTKSVVGAGWLTPMNVTSDPTSATEKIDDQDPDISVDDGMIHIAWVRSFAEPAVAQLSITPKNAWTINSTQIFYTNGTINGFETPIQVSSGGVSHKQPSLSLDSLGNAHIAWKNDTSWPHSVLYTNNNGGSFGTAENVSIAGGHHHSPSVFIDSDDYTHIAYAGWVTASGPLDVIYLKSEFDIIPPTIDHPADITYEENTTGHTITWNPSDNNPDSYTITRDDVAVESGPWDGSSITINVDDLSQGTYTFNCTVYGQDGNSANDTVIVTVTSPPTVTEFIGETIFLALAVIATAIILRRLIIKKSNPL
jgi:hypothetical protein